jgi:hypothetical protein
MFSTKKEEPTIRSNAGRKLIEERRARRKREQAKAKSSDKSFFSRVTEASDDDSVELDDAENEDSNSISGKFNSLISNVRLSFHGDGAEDDGKDSQARADELDRELYGAGAGLVVDEDADDDFDDLEQGYDDVFLGRARRERGDSAQVREYSWLDRAKTRYWRGGGTKRIFGCSCRTCLIASGAIFAIVVILAIVFAWNHKSWALLA